MKRDLRRLAAALTAAFLMFSVSGMRFYADEETQSAELAENTADSEQTAETSPALPPPSEPSEETEIFSDAESESISANSDTEADVSNNPITTSGTDFTADVSSAVISKSWGQSFVLLKEDFAADRITENSQVIIDYAINSAEIPADKLDANGELIESPVELIVQSWSEPNSPVSNASGSIWARVAPVSFTKKQAVFNYSDMIAAYGTNDFSNVDALNVGDTDIASMKCRGFTITNVLPPSDTYSAGSGINELIDISQAVPSNGYNEVLRLSAKDFDFTRITAETKLIVRYNMSQYSSSCPVALLIESEKNTTSPKAVNSGKFNVNILADSFNTQEAVFSCQGIVRAYGTGDFSQIDTLVFAGSGTNFVVTSIEFSDLLSEGLRSKLPDSRGEDDDITDTPSGETEYDMTNMMIISSIVVVIFGTLAAIIIIIKNKDKK